ncbi:major facilitator superfamily domain-containing protein [Trichoderma austrokoningii]
MLKTQSNIDDVADVAHEEVKHQDKYGGLEAADVAIEQQNSLDDVTMKKLVRRADLRIVPLLSFMYLLNYLDRGNLGNAKVLNEETGDDLLQQTGMTSTGYAISLSLFSIAYTLFEVPSNWILKRYVRPSLWLAILLFCWGATTLGFAGVKTYAQVIVLRFMIGIFEAGFFPGIVYFTTFWYRIEERGLRIAFVAAHANLAGAFGGVIAYGVGHLNGRSGLQGFRWLFIIEGIITVLLSFVLVFCLPDYPSKSRWLSENEKKVWEERLREQGAGYSKAHATRKEMLATCFSPRMLTHYLIYLINTIPLASFTFYTSTIVTGLGYKSLEAQLLTIPPWVVGYIFALLYSFSADRLNARGYHTVFGSILGGAGWLISGCLPSHAYTARYGCLVLASAGAFPCVAPLSAWVTGNSPSIATVSIAIALNNSAAGIGQIIAQWIWIASEVDRGYPTGNFTCAASSFAVAILSLLLRFWYGRMNKKNVPDTSGAPKVWAY